MGSLSPGAQRVCPAPGVEREGVDRRGQWAVGVGVGRGLRISGKPGKSLIMPECHL